MSVPARIGDVDVGHRARAREARVDVDDRRAALASPPSPSGSRPGGTRPCSSPDRGCSRRSAGPAGTWWRRRGRTRSPDRGPWSSVISGPGSRSARSPSAVKSFLMQVVLLVVERGAAEVRDAQRARRARRRAALGVLVRPPRSRRACAARARRPCPSPARARAPPTPCRPGRRYSTFCTRCGAGDELEGRGALRAQAPREIGESGSPSMSMIRSSFT